MHTVKVEPLTVEAFTPYGDVLTLPTRAGRNYYNDALSNARKEAGPSLSLSLREPSPALPLRASMLERHQYSSQTFIPIDVEQYLVVVAPHLPQGGPDIMQARAFLASGNQGVTYRADTWHHGMTVFGRPACFAVLMWSTGGEGDEEFVEVEPFDVLPN
ncbi:ureidoglycolate lyase [Bordetella muralis]|uniref:ureidoglycolate lyase n=1 Tax=Bordetella muralis TaxID=1649130 RepID=UPI0039F04D22